MPPTSRLSPALGLCLAAAWLLSACQTPAPVVATLTLPPAIETRARAAAPASALPATATPAASATATAIATAMAAATFTATPSPAATISPAATNTATATATAAATATATVTATPTTAPSASARPTPLPVTATPTSQPGPAPVFSTTGGPAGYSSSLQCQQAGAPCMPLMPPGDVSFRLTLASDANAPWTHFIYYGLSVEKDGANAPSMFMFVDAGWLQPGEVVGFGASRNFSLPGTYVIRSSGCLTTDLKSKDCTWATIAGDVVTFTVQP
jgi:hypothetical protein